MTTTTPAQSNWSGTITYTPAGVATPKTVETPVAVEIPRPKPNLSQTGRPLVHDVDGVLGASVVAGDFGMLGAAFAETSLVVQSTSATLHGAADSAGADAFAAGLPLADLLGAPVAAEALMLAGEIGCIAPGAYPSEMNKAAAKNPEGSARGIPSKRIGVAEDIAGGAIYLASRAGDYVVGTTIPIDGGIVNAWIPEEFNDPSGH